MIAEGELKRGTPETDGKDFSKKKVHHGFPGNAALIFIKKNSESRYP
jgi:hypothetical protein